MTLHILVFLIAALVEALNAAWFHAFERRRAGASGILSAVISAVSLVGIEQSFRGFSVAVCYVLGHGAGCYLFVAWKARQASP